MNAYNLQVTPSIKFGLKYEKLQKANSCENIFLYVREKGKKKLCFFEIT